MGGFCCLCARFMREVRNFGASVGTNREASTSTNAFNNQISYSSSQSSSSNFMLNISENEYWNDSPFNSLKRNKDGDMEMFSSNNFNGMTNQNNESRNYNTSGLKRLHVTPREYTLDAIRFLEPQVIPT